MQEDIYYYKGNPYVIVGYCEIKIHKQFLFWEWSKWERGISYQKCKNWDTMLYVRTANDFHSKFVKA